MKTENLVQAAGSYFDTYPERTLVVLTSDGTAFHEEHRSYAQAHARTLPDPVVTELGRLDLVEGDPDQTAGEESASEEVVTEEVVAEKVAPEPEPELFVPGESPKPKKVKTDASA